MKLIEALKAKKKLLKKADDLRSKVNKNCACYNYETSEYEDPKAKIDQWVQSHEDVMQQILKLQIAIQKTNLATQVTIELGDKNVTKSIAEWIVRRRELSRLDLQLWKSLNTNGMSEQKVRNSKDPDNITEVKIVRHYDAENRDCKVNLYSEEPELIDSRLEVINAITDLMEYEETK